MRDHEIVGEEIVVGSGVGVPVVLGEPTARGLDPDAVAGEKADAGRVHPELEAIDLLRLQQARGLERLAEAGPQRAVAEEARRAVGVDVDEADVPVGVAGGRGGVEDAGDRADDVERLAQGRAGVAEDVGAVARAAVVDRAVAQVPEAAGRIGGVVGVGVRRLLSRRLDGEDAVAVEAVGPAAGMEIERRRHGLR